MKVTATIVGEDAVGVRLAQVTPKLRQNLRNTIVDLGVQLQSMVKQYLSDDILHVRTGRLRRSINVKFGKDGGGTGNERYYASVGTNVPYAKVHEFGFSKRVGVAAYVRRVGKVKATTRQGVRVSTRQGIAFVRAHDRNMNIPARPFLRTALHDIGPTARRKLAQAIAGAVK